MDGLVSRAAMIALFCFFLALLVSPFKPKSRLEAENAALRHQLIVLQRMVRGRVQLTNGDRLFLVQLYRWFPSVLKAITIIRPETLVHWHLPSFRRYWRWKGAKCYAADSEVQDRGSATWSQFDRTMAADLVALSAFLI